MNLELRNPQRKSRTRSVGEEEIAGAKRTAGEKLTAGGMSDFFKPIDAGLLSISCAGGIRMVETILKIILSSEVSISIAADANNELPEQKQLFWATIANDHPDLDFSLARKGLHC